MTKKLSLSAFVFAASVTILVGCESRDLTEGSKSAAMPKHHDLILRGGTIYDGSGGPGYVGDLAIQDDRIVAMGKLTDATATAVIDVSGKAVSPGFINMMGWGVTSLIKDGRGLSDITQGITLEVFGEGSSMGPLNEQMKSTFAKTWDGIDPQWTSLGEYLEFLTEKGVSPNVASFVGAATLREYLLGEANVAPNAEQLEAMKNLVRQAMEEGALGVASSLIYTPGNFASTEELIELARAAGEYGGIYISHMRNEADGIFEALDELLEIARKANVPAEIYHLKLASKNIWHRFDELLAIVEAARVEGLKITADMYPYPAGSTGLDAIMPPWVSEGGFDDWVRRMQDPDIRQKLRLEMQQPSSDWENMYVTAGPGKILLVGFENPNLQEYVGRTLAQVAEERGTHPADTAMDLVIEDGSRVMSVYFTQSEEVVSQAIALPWVSFCTDSETVAAEGEFLANSIHPRGYGSFPRILGRYVRELGLLSLEEAIRKATALPADNLSLKDRGRLESGYYADVVVFDPATVIDNATFEKPHQYSTGIEQVFINGVQVLRDGKHTGAKPGRVVRGPGWEGWQTKRQD